MAALAKIPLTAAMLGIGLLGFIQPKSPGRLVLSQIEKASACGGSCTDQVAGEQWMCYCAGNGGSDCTGCGCTMDHPVISDSLNPFQYTLAPCDTNPSCTTNFARGSCSGT